jgi:hypothetical protein
MCFRYSHRRRGSHSSCAKQANCCSMMRAACWPCLLAASWLVGQTARRLISSSFALCCPHRRTHPSLCAHVHHIAQNFLSTLLTSLLYSLKLNNTVPVSPKSPRRSLNNCYCYCSLIWYVFHFLIHTHSLQFAHPSLPASQVYPNVA